MRADLQETIQNKTFHSTISGCIHHLDNNLMYSSGQLSLYFPPQLSGTVHAWYYWNLVLVTTLIYDTSWLVQKRNPLKINRWQMAGTDQNHSLSERSHLQTIQVINNSPELVSRVAASVSRWIQMCMEAVNPAIITKQGLFLIVAHGAT